MISISNESVFKIKLIAFLKECIKIGRILISPIKMLIVLMLRGLSSLWSTIFLVVYEHRKYLLSVVFKLMIFVDLILTIIYMVRLYGFNQEIKSLMYSVIGITSGTIGITLIFYIYYKLLGKNALLERNVMLTEKYVEDYIPAIIKIYGPPRIGKDTTGISITSILVRRNKRIIPIAMSKIRKICYIFDFQFVNQACNTYYEEFLSSSKSDRKKNFIKLCEKSDIQAFIKERYASKINYQELIDEYKYYLKNKVTFESEYMYNDGISKKHFLELLNEYMFLYVRLYIMKNFTLINQPYIEDPATGLMGKKYSAYYEAVATPPARTFNLPGEDGKKRNVLATEIIECPIIDWTMVYESERDSWTNNIDTKASKFVKEHHTREWTAFYGHSYEEVYKISICHDAARQIKLLRELDAFYINVLQRQEYLGAGKRVAVLSGLQRITNYFAEKGNLKLDDANNSIIYKRQDQIYYYYKLYLASGDDKYLALIEDIKNQELKKSSRFYDKMSRWNQKLMARIEQLQRKYGIIRITATISDQPTAPNLKEATLKQLLNRETPLYHEAYRVDFYFRMTDSMGRYNHKYMSDVLESRAKQSTTTFYDVECWEPSMVLSKQSMLHMAYPAGLELYGVTDEEVYDRWYEPMNKK